MIDVIRHDAARWYRVQLRFHEVGARLSLPILATSLVEARERAEARYRGRADIEVEEVTRNPRGGLRLVMGRQRA